MVGVHGVGALRLVEGAFRPRGGPVAAWPVGRVGLGSWRGAADAALPPEDVVVVRTAGGFEIHCHGGLAASAAILGDLENAGARSVTTEAWAEESGGVVASETLPLFSRVRGPRAARILARQHAGLLARAFATLESYVSCGETVAAETLGTRLLAAGRIGTRLERPWRVAVVGPVNAGKSSLVNALAGHARSIVSPEPGTTRDAVETALVLGGFEVILVDTAGFPTGDGRSPGATESAGIARAEAERRRADLVLRVVEADAPSPPPSDELVVRSKVDLVPGAATGPDEVATSAATGAGIDRLGRAIQTRLFPELVADAALLEGPVPFLESHLDRVRTLLTAARRRASSSGSGQ